MRQKISRWKIERPPLRNKSTDLEKLPRFKATHAGTPHMSLSTDFGQALIDEDIAAPDRTPVKGGDTTGLAFSGNMGRCFEFEIAHILEGGYDTVINTNHYRFGPARARPVPRSSRPCPGTGCR